MAEALPSVAFVGAGSMGGSILKGLVASGIPVDGGIYVTNRSAAKAEALSSLENVTSIALENTPDGNVDAVAAARVVLVGVKPYMIADLLDQIGPHLREDAIVVSLAAGITIAQFEDKLGRTSVIRSMPNTPSTVGKGVTGLAAGTYASEDDMAIVRRLFETVGDVVEVSGDDGIDAISTISGSGPAYVFLFIEKMIEAAKHQGFDDDTARLIAEKTFIGATTFLEASGQHPADLRRGVTSPKGTTHEAVETFQAAGLGDLFVRATDAAYARAKELAAEG
ncbi:pyrroline-5-carboxylate reductase [Microbacterium amylolyticum]|uniref:Pyrroline-5-carboxylate reductase n=1 Tax=Microbacterium amylolyticum TaxID=936337 RepID=A0ABS4ZJ60_9MICO|nr:pyrroline-5-carboxylate reductase [Microbacterium amylolyticum]MBP2437314.1 pyrroline-5-carboxylate reductase [Microbacterium amylolyticum]